MEIVELEIKKVKKKEEDKLKTKIDGCSSNWLKK